MLRPPLFEAVDFDPRPRLLEPEAVADPDFDFALEPEREERPELDDVFLAELVDLVLLPEPEVDEPFFEEPDLELDVEREPAFPDFDELAFEPPDLDELDFDDVDLDEPDLDAEDLDLEPDDEPDLEPVPDFFELDPDEPDFLAPEPDEPDFLLVDFLVSGILFPPFFNRSIENDFAKTIPLTVTLSS